MNSEHRKEQEEAHRRDFEAYWNDMVIPVYLDLGYSQEHIAEVKEGAWESWIGDDQLQRLLAKWYPKQTP